MKYRTGTVRARPAENGPERLSGKNAYVKRLRVRARAWYTIRYETDHRNHIGQGRPGDQPGLRAVQFVGRRRLRGRVRRLGAYTGSELAAVICAESIVQAFGKTRPRGDDGEALKSLVKAAHDRIAAYKEACTGVDEICTTVACVIADGRGDGHSAHRRHPHLRSARRQAAASDPRSFAGAHRRGPRRDTHGRYPQA